jgi:glycosyltransferase involved in cell wall biosynthesis
VKRNNLLQIIVAQLGARMHYAVPAIFHQAGMLQRFYTDFYAGPLFRSLLGKRAGLKPRVLQAAVERFHPDLPWNKVKRHNFIGYAYSLGKVVANGNIQRNFQIGLLISKLLCRSVRKYDLEMANIIYSFLGEGLPLTTSPAAEHLFKVTEVPTALPTFRLIIEEMKTWEDWCDPHDIKVLQKLIEPVYKMTYKHLAASDQIICPSRYVLEGVVEAGYGYKAVEVPYGYDLPLSISPETYERKKEPHSLKIVFVGNLNLNKGVQYLYQAARLLDDGRIDFHLVGASSFPAGIERCLQRHFRLWGHVPRSEVRRLFHEADIFVLPSISEGSATVCYEALAAGLPVITTPNSGSVVRDGIEGFLVPIRDPQTLAERIDLLAANPGLRQEMSQNAKARAREFTVAAYGKRLLEAIMKGWSERHC